MEELIAKFPILPILQVTLEVLGFETHHSLCLLPKSALLGKVSIQMLGYEGLYHSRSLANWSILGLRRFHDSGARVYTGYN